MGRREAPVVARASSTVWKVLLTTGAFIVACASPETSDSRTPTSTSARARTDVDSLPSWADGPHKRAIVDFLARVTTPGSGDFVEPGDRIAVFDNDGTLWAEQPIYVETQFALDRVRFLAPEHPEWRTDSGFSAVLDGDPRRAGRREILRTVVASHAGMTPDDFREIVGTWLGTARHPRFDRPYTDLVYAPMVELLQLLRQHGFATYVVSGGETEFMRAWCEDVYGIPPARVVGSSIETELVDGDRGPELVRAPNIEFVDDGAGKPVAIGRVIGSRPIVAFGNSDGDHDMLRWTAAGGGPRLVGLVHHTDAEREWAYDRDSEIGKLDQALDDAFAEGWLVVDMAEDWNVVFAFERAAVPTVASAR